jgi:hypothetical protein
VRLPVLANLENALKRAGNTETEKFTQQQLDCYVTRVLALPLALAIRNSSSSGIRNVYVQLQIEACSPAIEIVTQLPRFNVPSVISTKFAGGGPIGDFWSGLSSHWYTLYPNYSVDEGDSIYARIERRGLSKDGDKWRLAFEWDALQPQLVRYVPLRAYVIARESGSVRVSAKVFADSFPQPVSLSAELQVTVEPVEVDASQVLDSLTKQGTPFASPG